LTPAILGEAEPEDGIIKTSFPIGERPVWFLAPRTVEHPTKHGDYKIQIFNGPSCAGAPIAEGTAEALEETGITVVVAGDAKTTLSAIQLNLSSEASPCSNPLYYYEGNVPPEETPGGTGTGGGESNGGGPGGNDSGGGGNGPGQGPSGTPTGEEQFGNGGMARGKPDAPQIHMSPSDLANTATPRVVGSAPGAASVVIYGDGACAGTPVAKGAPSQLASGIEVSVPENAATTFSAVAIGSQRSSCSSPVTYTEDSSPPRTRITMGPGVKTRKRKAVFRFKDVTEDPPGTTFNCRVNRAKWKPCSSPFRIKHLKPSHYTLRIRATDLAGNVERKPIKRLFIVVRH
jgi:hypothetical protein